MHSTNLPSLHVNKDLICIFRDCNWIWCVSINVNHFIFSWFFWLQNNTGSHLSFSFPLVWSSLTAKNPCQYMWNPLACKAKLSLDASVWIPKFAWCHVQGSTIYIYYNNSWTLTSSIFSIEWHELYPGLHRSDWS